MFEEGERAETSYRLRRTSERFSARLLIPNAQEFERHGLHYVEWSVFPYSVLYPLFRTEIPYGVEEL
jgi:hypothetical protein